MSKSKLNQRTKLAKSWSKQLKVLIQQIDELQTSMGEGGNRAANDDPERRECELSYLYSWTGVLSAASDTLSGLCEDVECNDTWTSN